MNQKTKTFVKKEYVILLLIVAFNFLIRINFVKGFNIMNDTNFNINLASSLINQHYAIWNLNLLSLFGLSHSSYPFAFPLLNSIISLLTDLNLKTLALTLPLINSIINILGIYILLKEIKNDKLFYLLGSIIYSLSPIFFLNSYSMLSSRQLLLVLLPYFFLFQLKFFKSKFKNYKYLFLFTIISFVLALTHRLGSFILVLNILVIFINYVWNKFEILRKYRHLTFLSSFFVLMIFGSYWLKSPLTQESNIFSHIPLYFLRSLFLYFYHIANLFGILILFSSIGFIILIFKRNASEIENFSIIFFIILIFFLKWDYFIYVSIIFLVLFATYGLTIIINNIKTKKIQCFFIFLILISGLTFLEFKKEMKFNIEVPTWDKDADKLLNFFTTKIDGEIFSSNNAELILLIQSNTQSIAVGTPITMVPTKLDKSYEISLNLNPISILKLHKWVDVIKKDYNLNYIYYLINTGKFSSIQKFIPVNEYVHDTQQNYFWYYSSPTPMEYNIFSDHTMNKYYNNGRYHIYNLK